MVTNCKLEYFDSARFSSFTKLKLKICDDDLWNRSSLVKRTGYNLRSTGSCREHQGMHLGIVRLPDTRCCVWPPRTAKRGRNMTTINLTWIGSAQNVFQGNLHITLSIKSHMPDKIFAIFGLGQTLLVLSGTKFTNFRMLLLMKVLNGQYQTN